MGNQPITFDTLPQAIGRLISKVDALERRLANNTSSPEKELPELLNTKEASELLKIAKQTLYAKVMRREIPHMKQGKMLLFHRSELLQYLHEGKRSTIKETEQQSEKEAEERFAKSIQRKKKP